MMGDEQLTISSLDDKKKKKPYKELTLNEKVQLIRLAEENAGLSQAAIAERYSIAKSNVCRILQRKKEYLSAYESAGFSGSRKRKLKAHEQSENLSGDGNETLRAHMYKQHQVSRMFMCRCCNWAFPDKTSLHMHIQAREEGKPMPVSVIGKGIGPTDRVGPMIDRSAFAPVNTVGNTLPPLPPPNVGPTVPPPGGLPFFPSATQPLPPSPEELSRIRERLMLNSLMTQPGFSLGWLSQLPKPIPTTRPSIGLPKPPEDDLVVNVDKDDEKCDDDDEKQVSGSDSDEPKSESSRLAKRSDSPCENGSSSSTDGSSPSHASSAHSPINLFKKDPEMPSAFHQLNVDSRPFGTSPHVSPSDTNSSISPDGSCFECAVFKTKLSIAENKCRYMESRANTLQTEAVRAQSSAAAAEATVRVLENETRALREHADQLQRRLLDCQEQALRFVQSERTQSPQAVALFLNQLIQSTIVR